MYKETLANCLPHIDTLIEENRLFRNSVLTKIQTYLQAQSELPDFLEKNIANRWKESSVTPSLVSLSYILKNQRIPLEMFVAGLQERFEKPFSLITPPYPDWAKKLIEIQNNSPDRGEEAGTLIQEFSGETSIQGNFFQAAFLFLEKNWPEAAFCIGMMIKCIVLVASESFWSSSMPTYQGAILAAPKPYWHLAHYVETLVHESAHLELNIRRMLDPLITNPRDIAYSSFRKSNRPLLGILHAAFVLVRTRYALDLLQPHHPQQHFQSSLKMQKEFSYDLYESLDVLKKTAKFTPLGAQLFKNMSIEAEKTVCK